MLDFEQVKTQYSDSLQVFERAILREYLQYKILEGIFKSKQASRVSFMGGTALRIIHDNSRFSEDVDLDNFGLTWEEFGALVDTVQRFLALEGFEVTMTMVEKAAYHCNIHFPNILFEHGISPLPDEKILIQVDTLAQGYDYQPEIKILNKFDVFTEIRVTPLNVLLSQKIYAAVNRKRPKGRDFYDITFLLGRTKPDYGYIEQKMGINNPQALRDDVLQRIEKLDFDALAGDVSPFLLSQDEKRRVTLFRTVWTQADLG